MDTPDIGLRNNQYIIINFEYWWGSLHRSHTSRGTWHMNIHLKDLLKLRQNALQSAYRKEQAILGGSPPVLENINITIVS
jgi:hypothetical protein